MKGVGGLPPRRPDQRFTPPPTVLTPGSSAGIFRGFQVVVSGTGAGRGIFVYSPTFALGNLIGSIGPGGTGPLGETYPPGITWGLGTTVQIQLTTGSFPAGSGIFQFLLNNVLFNSVPAIYGSVKSDVNGTYGEYDWVGPSLVLAGHTDLCYVSALSSDTVNSAFGWLVYQDITGTGHVYGQWDAGGLHVVGDVTAVTPGTGTIATPGTKETWHAMAGSYSNSWSDFGVGQTVGRYRKVASPPNSVEVEGIIVHASISGQSTFFTLPAGYRPAANTPVCECGTYTGTVFGSALIDCDTSGNLTLYGLASNTTTAYFHGFVSLD